MNEIISGARISNALGLATKALLGELPPSGHWTGTLSSSALSTATACIALSLVERHHPGRGAPAAVERGLLWLAAHQNPDGGWGDTTLSRSNISTTALVWAAFGAAGKDAFFSSRLKAAVNWLQTAAGHSQTGWEEHLADAIRRRYGKDRTFSVPILTACILAGRMGGDGWRHVPVLPFELATLPHGFYGALQLPVVSYALPALIAIGRSIHRHAPTKNPLVRWLRNCVDSRTAAKLERLQPSNGGFLEATPLTSFVLMNLASIGEALSPTGLKSAEFLRASVREDGSWPIDTNLSTWLTTWAVSALSQQPECMRYEERSTLKEWLLGQQYKAVHPYTNAAPGGWAWTNLPGGVPDADDTPGALLALLTLGPVDSITRRAAEEGTRWLLNLQNRDGGIPTFCKGWGALPFDRSGDDLTAHALRAWSAWLPHWQGRLRSDVLRAVSRATAFLRSRQRPDGTWIPLWFGNQHVPGDENPTWGTSKVILALRDLQNRGIDFPAEMLHRSKAALAGLQQKDGGWSGGRGDNLPSSVEETGAALEALAGTAYTEATDRGTAWLLQKVESGEWTQPSPIGFYFAKLWYFERLYPQITTVAALGAVLKKGAFPGGSVSA
jgi:squalene-hopene/tetraprenyl-beta-curcumene cyclase